jgi:hypothetical protein
MLRARGGSVPAPFGRDRDVLARITFSPAWRSAGNCMSASDVKAEGTNAGAIKVAVFDLGSVLLQLRDPAETFEVGMPVTP